MAMLIAPHNHFGAAAARTQATEVRRSREMRRVLMFAT